MKKIYLILAAIFLFNPIVSVIDVLPDVFGYLFLLKFFHVMSYTNDKVDDLCKSIKALCLITGIKLLSLLLLPILTTLDQAMFLVFSFVFAILECIFAIPFFIKMFECFSDIALYENNVECANNNIIRKLTVISLSVRLTLAAIPDFTFLSISNGVDTPTGISLLQFRPLLFVFSAFASLIVGVVWLISFIKYVRKLITPVSIKLLKEDYKRKAFGRELLFLTKDSIFYLTAMCFVSALVVDFNFNLINVFFDSFFSIALTMILILMSKKDYYKDKLMLVIISLLSVFHLTVDIVLTVNAVRFFEKFNLNSIQRSPAAEDMYFKICTLSVISSLFFIVIVFLICYSLYANAKEILLNNTVIFIDASRDALKEEFELHAKSNLRRVFVFSLISAIAYCCYMFFRHLLPVTTLFNSIAEIMFMFVFIKAILYLYDNVYKRLYIHT